jgi:GNAT superfamily N-acetyltransferase
MVTSETQTTIRALTVAELPLCVPFGQAFFEEFQLRGTFHPEHFLKTWTVFVEQLGAVVLALSVNEQVIGGLGALDSLDVFTGERVATEMFWYIDPAHRTGTGALRLLRAFEAWGRSRGATELRLSHFMMKNNDPLQRLYEHRGYTLLEQGYQKRLEGELLCR